MADLAIAQNGYRPRRYYLIVGIVGVVFFSAAAIISTYVAYWNIDGSFARPVLAAVIFGSFWSLFTLLSVWVVLAYYRECLTLDEGQITQQGIIRSKLMHIDDVTHIKWRRIPQGGSIVIRTLTDRLKIYFDNFTVEERRELISFLHGIIAPNIQEGWSQFEECHLKIQQQPIQKSRSAAVVCALLLFSFAGIFNYCWVAGLGSKWLFIGAVNALGGLWCLWRICTFRNHASNEKSA